MLKSRAVLLVALLAGSASTPCAPAPETYYFDCDVPAAKSSEWNRTLTARAVRVSGTVQLIERREDKRWWPVASVFLIGDNESAWVGLQVYVDRQTPNELQLSLRDRSASKERTPFASLPWQDRPIPFTLSLSESGELRVSAGGQSQSVQVGAFEVRKLALSCSTGQFKFTDVSATSE